MASIKPNVSADFHGTWRFTGGGLFTGENINLRFLLSTAFQLRDSQLAGVPGWADSAKYDIEARGETAPSEQQITQMLQSLLTDRFKLHYHVVTKEGPVYALVVAKNGIRIEESKDGPCARQDPDKPGPVECATWFTHRNLIEAKRIRMPNFARVLEGYVDRTVIDKTGFTKPFDARLEWTPAEAADNPDGDSGPSIFTAIQEQLGLRLKPQKGPVETFVIDQIEKPDEN